MANDGGIRVIHFDHFTPTRVSFGAGRLSEIGRVAQSFGGRALIVCGRGAMRRTGVLDRVAGLLLAAGVEHRIHDDVSANPLVREADAGVALARHHRCDVVIGLGGGSAIDAAKAVAVGVSHESVGPLVGTTLSRSAASLPLIAIPTTAGTGAEVTKGAILIDERRQFKSGIRGDDLFARHAIVDPDLTATLPRLVALETGFDALTHAIESYLAKQSNPVAQALSEKAVGLLVPALERIAAGDNDAALRESMSLAALIGGLNVATASTCLPHRLQQAIGSVMRVQTTHARGLAIVYPAWLRHVSATAGDGLARIAGHFGSGDPVEIITAFLGRIGMRSSLREAGYERGDIDTFVRNVSGNIENDPTAGIGPDLFRAIFEESL